VKKENNNKCSVYLWDTHVGEIILIKENLYFKYNKNFKMNISPIELPLSTSQFNFSQLHYQYGLPGVFSDSLPDGFGMKIIDDYFQDNYPNFKPNIVDKLLFIGDVSFGALSYKPAYNISKTTNIPIELAQIKQHKKNILSDKSYLSIKEAAAVYRSFSPAGGAREKIILNYNKTDKSFSVGFNKKFDTPILLKLDESLRAEDGRNGIIEYIYSQIAKKAGINITDTYLFKDDEGFSHFAIDRFDVNENGEKLHQHTLSGLLNFDKSKRIDYSDFMNIAKTHLLVKKPDLEEIYRRMIFNFVYNNNDDHLKNHSFIMNEKGEWSISPAYDLTFNDKIAQRTLMLNINGKRSSEAKFEDFQTLAEKFEIENFREIIQNILNTREYFAKMVKKMIPEQFDLDIQNYLNFREIDGFFNEELINNFIKDCQTNQKDIAHDEEKLKGY
jgi:serine/threonine-protein kinase HipA